LKSTYDAFVANIQSQKTALESARQTAQESVNYFKGIFDMLGSEIDKLRGEFVTVDSTSAISFIDRAIQTGYLPNQEELGDAISTVNSTLVEENFATRFEAQRANLRFVAKLTQLQDVAFEQQKVAENQLTSADQQIVLLEQQIAQANEQYSSQVESTNAYYDQVIQNAQDQLDALNNVNNSVLSVADAVANLQRALGSLATARTVLTTTTTTPKTPIITPTSPEDVANYDAVTGLYLDVLGRTPEQSGLDFWTSQLGSGASINDIRDALESSAENLAQEVNQMYQDILGRSAESEGLNFWTGQLSSGASFEDIRSALEGSAEAKARGFASGGYYPGGLAMVGENGPELINFSDPGMVYNAGQTSRILAGGDDVVTEIRNLREENKVQSRALVNLQNRMTRLLERWDGDGLPEERMVTA
jgi:hypothetical protein